MKVDNLDAYPSRSHFEANVVLSGPAPAASDSSRSDYVYCVPRLANVLSARCEQYVSQVGMMTLSLGLPVCAKY